MIAEQSGGQKETLSHLIFCAKFITKKVFGYKTYVDCLEFPKMYAIPRTE